MNHPFLQALETIYPAERILTRDAQLLPYESDALTAFNTKPGAVVIPLDEAEVIATVRLCPRAGCALCGARAAAQVYRAVPCPSLTGW